MDVNLEYYKIFYYVGKLGGISLAAEELSISQPAVSQSIKQLEKALGSTLFIRTPKGVKLTTEGETLYLYIKRGYEYIKMGESKFRDIQNLENGEIRIGASDMTLQYYLLPFLEKFHEQYPKIKVHVTNAPTPSTMKYLQEGKIDFGVVSSPIKERQGLNIKKVREIEDIFVGGEKFKQWKGKKLSYKELEQLPVICLEKDTSTRAYVDAFLEKNNVKLNPEFELATSDMLVQFALRSLGIASVMRDFAKKYIENDELFELQFNEAIPRRHFCIITDEKVPISTASAKLLEQLV
ncbi:LysR family transcriptional regulator [Velocimicrobium porci]|uniref:LysR family transcriptional regulator n=1 Tax=Velocimicrobium porci TaxID=2606634 RepID=A0A6L5XXL3_9FIRM|nr:LysR family transcriptional regulator [Velocimicrobium porci]MSS63502.1 LysR family transcriptional regulator [Velocimicrobium porci]